MLSIKDFGLQARNFLNRHYAQALDKAWHNEFNYNKIKEVPT